MRSSPCGRPRRRSSRSAGRPPEAWATRRTNSATPAVCRAYVLATSRAAACKGAGKAGSVTASPAKGPQAKLNEFALHGQVLKAPCVGAMAQRRLSAAIGTEWRFGRFRGDDPSVNQKPRSNHLEPGTEIPSLMLSHRAEGTRSGLTDQVAPYKSRQTHFRATRHFHSRPVVVVASQADCRRRTEAASRRISVTLGRFQDTVRAPLLTADGLNCRASRKAGASTTRLRANFASRPAYANPSAIGVPDEAMKSRRMSLKASGTSKGGK